MTKQSHQMLNGDPFPHAERACRAVHGEEVPFTVKLLHRDPIRHEIKRVTFEFGTLQELRIKFPAWREDGLEPLLMLGNTDGRGMAKSSVLGARAVAVDFDRGVDADMWDISPIKPTFVVRTSPGRYHFVWVLEQCIDVDEAEQFVLSMAHRFDGDPAFGNVTQAIRLPGFLNGKRGNEVRFAVAPDQDRCYEKAFLYDACDIQLVTHHLRRVQPSFDSRLQLQKTDVSADHLFEDLRSALAHIPATDYDVWFKVLAALHSLGESGLDFAHDWSASCQEKYDRDVLNRKWRSLDRAGTVASVRSIFAMASDHGWKNPGRRPTTDGLIGEPISERALGSMIADRMRQEFAAVPAKPGGKLEYVLLRWNGELYEQLELVACRDAVEKHFRMVIADLQGSSGLSKREFIRFVATKAGSNRQLDVLADHVMERLYEASTGNNDVTGYPYFPVANGVLNLLSRQMVPRKYRPLARMRAGASFDPNADAPRFRQALEEIFNGNKDLIAYVLRVLGYCLLGKPKEHLFVVFHGPKGRNGKSVLVDVLSQIMGDYAQTLSTSFIMVKSHVNDNATPSLAKLVHRRLAIVPEPNKRHQLDSGFIKQLTGGDQVAARALYGNEIRFEPEFVLLMVTNVIPELREDDHALWRRMRIVPFDRSFSDEEIDPDLKQKLLGEREGILNLLLDGLHDYLTAGLQPPAIVRRAGSVQREAIDPFQQWAKDRVQIVGKQMETRQKDLLTDYQNWAPENASYRKLTQNEFREKLSELAAREQIDRISRGNIVIYAGLQLRE